MRELPKSLGMGKNGPKDLSAAEVWTPQIIFWNGTPSRETAFVTLPDSDGQRWIRHQSMWYLVKQTENDPNTWSIFQSKDKW